MRSKTWLCVSAFSLAILAAACSGDGDAPSEGTSGPSGKGGNGAAGKAGSAGSSSGKGGSAGASGGSTAGSGGSAQAGGAGSGGSGGKGGSTQAGSGGSGAGGQGGSSSGLGPATDADPQAVEPAEPEAFVPSGSTTPVLAWTDLRGGKRQIFGQRGTTASVRLSPAAEEAFAPRFGRINHKPTTTEEPPALGWASPLDADTVRYAVLSSSGPLLSALPPVRVACPSVATGAPAFSVGKALDIPGYATPWGRVFGAWIEDGAVVAQRMPHQALKP